MTEQQTDDLISTQEAAEILGLTRQAVGWLIRKKGLRAVRVGGRRYVLRRADVEAYRQRREDKG